MNSKIRIEHDFENNEPFIQFHLERGDVNDAALEFFIYQAKSRGITIQYPKHNEDNSCAQIRVMQTKERENCELEAVAQMCAESLSKEMYAKFTDVYNELRKIRPILNTED